MTKGVIELLKDYKPEKLNLTEESFRKFLFYVFKQERPDFKPTPIEIDVISYDEFSVEITAGDINYFTGLGGFLMYGDKQDFIKVTYNGVLLDKEEVSQLFKVYNSKD